MQIGNHLFIKYIEKGCSFFTHRMQVVYSLGRLID
jgi:hypothetical protein